MSKANRFNVRCTLCNEVFQNDYVTRHTKSKHKDLHNSGRNAPTAVVIEGAQRRQRTMDLFIGSSTSTSRKRRIDEDILEPHEMELDETKKSEELETEEFGEQTQGK
jgi:hypothetical protein